MEYFKCSWIGRINVTRVDILPKCYSFNATPIKVSMIFHKEIEKAVIKFTWKNKKPRIFKTILSEKKWRRQQTSQDPISNYTIVLQKWHGIGTKTGKMSNGTEKTSQRQKSHAYCLVNLDKGTNNIHWKKRQPLKQMVLRKLKICMWQNQIEPLPLSLHKTQLKVHQGTRH